jgi:pilus assembly protein CpaE
MTESDSILCVVHGAKGGSGATTVAANVAAAMLRLAIPSVPLLVDFSTNPAGVRALLDVDAARSLGTIAAAGLPLDAEFIRSCIMPHRSGMTVLAAADDADEAGGLPLPIASLVLQAVRPSQRVVIVDVDPHYTDHTIAALAAADRIVLLVTGDILSVRAARRTLEVYRRLGLALDRVLLVLNRASADDALDATDVAALLYRPVAAVIADERRAFADAQTHAQLMHDHTPRSPTNAAFLHLAGVITGASTDRTNGRLRRFFAGR